MGFVAALSNNSGQIVERYSYDVFGAPNRVSDVNNPYMFTGRRFDSETGLYYYRFRDYKPDIGRFLQPDPIGYYYSMNLYEYYGNNPLVFPLGFWRDLWKVKGWIGGVVLGTGVVLAFTPAAPAAPYFMIVGGVLIITDIVDKGVIQPKKAVKPLEEPVDNINKFVEDNELLDGEPLYRYKKKKK